MKLSLFLCTALVTSLASDASPDSEPMVPVMHLLAHLDEYDGKEINVTGYLTVELENDSLCASARESGARDCLWVNLDDGPWESADDEKRVRARLKELAHYGGQLVSLRATLDKTTTGHLGMWSAGLRRITAVRGARCLSSLPPRAPIMRSCAAQLNSVDTS